MKYFEIKDKKLQELFKNIWEDQPRKWNEAIPEFNRILESEYAKDIVRMCEHGLYVSSIPLHLKDQFSTKEVMGCYLAKKKSKINKEFLEVCKKYQLTSLTATEIGLSFNSNLFGYKSSFHYFGEGKCYMETEAPIDKDEGRVKEITETDFLEKRLKYLKEKGK